MLTQKIVIAIDGHSSSGKSSFASMLAEKLDYTYIDTGAMYRAVTLMALRTGALANKINTERLIRTILPMYFEFRRNSTTNKNELFVNGENMEPEIRSMEISQCVSQISAIPFVRHLMVERQQFLGINKGVVMDGRDIGTTVFPNAELKIFLTAAPAIRAKRRYDELLAAGKQPDFAAIEQNIRARDYADEHRRTSPLRKADDAILLDNSTMTLQQQMDWVMSIINEKF